MRGVTAGTPGPCSLDVCPANVQRCAGFSSRGFAANELEAVFGEYVSGILLTICEGAGLCDAFKCRNELVNFKKQCLTVFQGHQRVDFLLRRYSSLFFCDVVCTSREDPAAVMYARVSGATMLIKGRLRAILDLREGGKFICQTPRHPGMDDCEYPTALRNLPCSMGTHQIVLRAEAFVQERCGGVVAATEDLTRTIAEEGNNDFHGLMKSISASSLCLRRHELDYVEKCLIARGCHKAIRVRAALVRWRTYLLDTLLRASTCLACFRETAEFSFDLRCVTAVAPGTEIRYGMHCSMHACLLQGAIPVLQYAAEVVGLILSAPESRIFDAGDFGFRSNTGRSNVYKFLFAYMIELCKYYQSGALTAPDISEVPPAIRRVLADCSDNLELAVGYKIVAFRGSNQKNLFVCFQCKQAFPKMWVSRGLRTGQRCVCMPCEKTCRKAGRCPWGELSFDESMDTFEKNSIIIAGKTGNSGKSCPGESMWCSHLGVCLACDENVEGCLHCMFMKGDGENVLEIVQRYSAFLEHVFVDFDGTLSSTKKGENPLGSGKSLSKPEKRSQKHSVDPFLRELCYETNYNNQGSKINVQIVTRNTHKANIELFLDSEGCNNATMLPVHVVGRRLGSDKVGIIQSILDKDTKNSEIIEAKIEPSTYYPIVRAIIVDDTLEELLEFARGTIPGMKNKSQQILRIHFGNRFSATSQS